MKLTSGANLTVPLKLIKYALRDAHDPAVVAKWKPILAVKERAFDSLIRPDRTGGGLVLNDIQGSIGNEEDGKVQFKSKDTGKNVQVDISIFQAMLFANGPPPGAKPQLFRLNDMDGNVIPVAALTKKDDGYTVATIGGVKLEVTNASLVKLDFSRGKRTYLSSTELPYDGKPKVTCNLVPEGYADLIFGPVIDKVKSPTTSDLLPIRMGGVTYAHGLSVHAYTELVYKVNSEYEWFNAKLGFDDEVGGLAVPVIVQIFGDGKELETITLNRADYKEPKDLKILIKDVDRLIIKVKSGGLLDNGWVEFGDARVSK
jgi:hypothetical protein